MFVTGLNRSHAATQEKLSNTKLTFKRAVEIAVNMTIVKEYVRQFHSPGGATIGATSSENVKRVRSLLKQSEGKYPRQVNIYRKQDQQAS